MKAISNVILQQGTGELGNARGAAGQISSAGSHTMRASDSTRLHEATSQFEAIFLRQMLSSLEKTASASATGGDSAGGSVYGSMVVNAVADAVAQAGGLGLGRALADSIEARNPTARTQPQAGATGKEASTNPAEGPPRGGNWGAT